MKKISTYKKKAWDLLSKVKRYVDWVDGNGNNTCYTCGTVKPAKEMQAGHLLDGRSNSILFEERALKPQCYSCNCMKSGNKEVFIPKFIDEHGRELYDELMIQKKQTLKISRSEYEEMIKSYKERLTLAPE